jgi:DNA processing protein
MILASIPGLSQRRLLEAARCERSAAACLERVRAGRLGTDADRQAVAAVDPAALEIRLAERGARFVPAGSEEYPAELGDLADPPAALFVRGRSLSDIPARVAVVGARNCSALGEEVAAAIGRGLGDAGVGVVSGGARGIDTAAHRGSLDAGGPTVCVLGSGIDVTYPLRNARLLDRIAQVGAVVSEYPPGVPAQPFRFPARNRIVAAMSEAVVIVEGAAGSGSLITADFALDLGRPVYAVPGPVTSQLSEVPLALIREGAGMIRGAEDLLLDLGHLDPLAHSDQADAGKAPESRDPAGGGLSAQEKTVLAAVAGPTLPEQVARTAGIDLAEVVPILLGLELRGLVRTVGGRVDRRLSGRR